MKADLFYLDYQEPLVQDMESLLQKHVFANLTLVPHKIDLGSQYQALGVGRRYIRLLNAALPSEMTLNVGYFEAFGHRLYIELYTTFNPYTSYSYDFYYTPNRPDLMYFFPAVAVNGRMAVVPSGMKAQLHLESDSSPFRTAEIISVVEADFSQKLSVEQGLAALARRVRAEFLLDLRSYASHHRWQEIDLARLARDLEVSHDFIASMIGPGALALSNYDLIRCSVDRERIPFDRWSKLILTARNESESDLGGLRVLVSGPVHLRPSRLEAKLAARSQVEIAFAVLPQEKGEFPLEISFVRPGDDLFLDRLPVHHVWLQCE